jgi:ectoine hydroxylase-related dioxygenase (phytanoyl-CoA dioxygenase family)
LAAFLFCRLKKSPLVRIFNGTYYVRSMLPYVEEMNIRGCSVVTEFLNRDQALWLGMQITAKKANELVDAGEQVSFLDVPEKETLRGLVRFGDEYNKFLENVILQECVLALLGPKAILNSYNAVITRKYDSLYSQVKSYKFHRDHHYTKDTRTSVLFMIPLVDTNEDNGATQVVPGTHLFRKRPSEDFLQKHAVTMSLKAGTLLLLDPTVWHCAGRNRTEDPRPVLVMRFAGPLIKPQIDWCIAYPEILTNASTLLKRLLGWDCRVPIDHKDRWKPEDQRMFRMGQYDTTNTSIHDTGHEQEYWEPLAKGY